MDLSEKTRKDIGALGEKVAGEYLRRRGFVIIAKNVAWKTGELDIVARKDDVLHIVEVKSLVCKEFPTPKSLDRYSPEDNLHSYKIRKVARTAEWYVAQQDWEGEWQVDGALVWLREYDGLARIRYLPQIL